MLNFLKSKPDLKQNPTLLKNAVTFVTLLPPLSSKGYSGKKNCYPIVTFVTDFVTSVTAVTEKSTQKQRGNKVTKVTVKKTISDFTSEDWLTMFEERASIFEYEAGLKRVEAEIKSFDECILQLLKIDKKHTLNTVVPYLMACGLHNPFYN